MYKIVDKQGNKYGILDTKDKVTEYYTRDEVKQFFNSGIEIYGVDEENHNLIIRVPKDKAKSEKKQKKLEAFIAKQEFLGNLVMIIPEDFNGDYRSYPEWFDTLEKQANKKWILSLNYTEDFSFLLSRFGSDSAMMNRSHVGTIDLTKLSFKNIITIRELFRGVVGNIVGLENLDVSNVEDMSKTFEYCNINNLRLNTWNTHNVKNMFSMFSHCEVTEVDISKWDTSNIEDVNCMFKGFKGAKVNISGLNTSNLTEFVWIFADTNCDVIGLEDLDISNITALDALFSDEDNISNKGILTYDLSKWNVSKVENINWIFRNRQCEIKGLEDWNIKVLREAWGAFEGSIIRGTLNLSRWGTNELYNLRNMFANCEINTLILANWNFDKVSDIRGMFSEAKINTLDLSGIRIPDNRTLDSIIYKNKKLSDIRYRAMDISPFNKAEIGTLIISDKRLKALAKKEKGIKNIIFKEV